MKPFQTRRALIFTSILSSVLATGCANIGQDDTANNATLPLSMDAGIGAKLACSGVFSMERDSNEVIERDLRPFLAPMFDKATFDFDFKKKTARATVDGKTQTALYRPGLGCTLMIDTTRKELRTQARRIKAHKRPYRPELWPKGDAVTPGESSDNIDWTQLSKAIDGAFVDNTEKKVIDTRAVIVVYDGKIIAERYAEGFDENSRFLSWSASKSVTSALIGTLVTDGKLNAGANAPVPEWTGANDSRGKITLHQLLTMSSGLEFQEHPYEPGVDSTEMLFTSGHMGDYVAAKPLEHEPGAKWSYSSGTTNLLSRILFDETGGTLKKMHDYTWDRFFEPVGMTSSVFEVDVHGAYVGSSSFYASARDWARFGLLYLNDGKVDDKQILSKEWIEYTTTPTPLAPQGMYGAQFWLNGGHPTDGGELMLPDNPKDMYLAMGFNGQYTAIVPSRNAVIVRLGWSTGADKSGQFDTNKHFSEILKAIPDTQVQ